MKRVLMPCLHFKNPSILECSPCIQKDSIKIAVVSDSSGYGYNVWDGSALSDYTSNKYGISLCVRQRQRFLHDMGFALIRPQAFPSKGREDAPECDELKKLTDLEKDPDAIIVFQNEVYFMAESTVT